ncbi:uncharacterized protein METZ01_LOCUS110322 [marine metagenome]|uniref:Uncharacterized protein n=1 Tax=marine metagenome TaxID=408172 RepID=A0A381WYW2_9ZZZZ
MPISKFHINMDLMKKEIIRNPTKWKVYCNSKGYGYNGIEEPIYNFNNGAWIGPKFQIKIRQIKLDLEYKIINDIIFYYDNNMRIPIKVDKNNDTGAIVFQINSRKLKTVSFIPV